MTAPTRRPDDRPVMPSRPPPAVYVMNDEDGNWVVIFAAIILGCTLIYGAHSLMLARSRKAHW